MMIVMIIFKLLTFYVISFLCYKFFIKEILFKNNIYKMDIIINAIEKMKEEGHIIDVEVGWKDKDRKKKQ